MNIRVKNPATSVEEAEAKAQTQAGSLGALPDIDPLRLVIQLANTNTLKPIPAPETLVFGQTMTDHMLEVDFFPESGWSAPVIKPYGPVALDPACSVFHYTPALFEGMKAFVGPDGAARLFRPDLNMKRMVRSADRIALPEFDGDALLVLIKKLVQVDQRWIPAEPGYSLYIRPTLIGTRPSLGVAASSHAKLFVIMSPTGPYFPTGFKPITLFAECDAVRSWPGGTGAYKLGINYTPTFKPQREAAKRGYQQILWVLGQADDRRVTEVGQMNFFAVVERSDGDLDVITPPLDGTILPGVTRASVIALCDLFNTQASLRPFLSSPPALLSTGVGKDNQFLGTPSGKSAPQSTLSSPSSPCCYLPAEIDSCLQTPTSSSLSLSSSSSFPKLHIREATIKLADLERLAAAGTLRECFGSGTAAVICPVGKIGVLKSKPGASEVIEDIILPEYEGGLGPVAGAMYRALVAIYEGRVDVEGWSVPCSR